MDSEKIIDYNATNIFKALASKTRWDILQLLTDETKNFDVSRIAEAMNQTEANISAQIKFLEKAGLVISHYEPGEHGVRKVCEPACEKLIIKIFGNSDPIKVKAQKKGNSRGGQPTISKVSSLEEFNKKVANNPNIGDWQKLTFYQGICDEQIYNEKYCPKCNLPCKFAGKILNSLEE